MKKQELLSASSAILRKAKQSGAHLAGFANVNDLKMAPSFVVSPQLQDRYTVLETPEDDIELNPGEVQWPQEANSVLVVAVEHPPDKPELDWWYGQIAPSGNKVLVNIVRELCEWVPAHFDIDVFHFPYCISQGGIYLKDAAVIAGLGCIGKNNLLVTPDYGPRIRLRAMALNVPIPSTGPLKFDPCTECDDFCHKLCPQLAFDEQIYRETDYNLVNLPGRDGRYSRPHCFTEMRKNEDDANAEVIEGYEKPVKIYKYCRKCELNCPVGR